MALKFGANSVTSLIRNWPNLHEKGPKMEFVMIYWVLDNVVKKALEKKKKKKKTFLLIVMILQYTKNLFLKFL